MKYYSEILKKAFNTEKECVEAEEKYQSEVEAAEKKKAELVNARKARAKEIEDARKEVYNAQKHYNELLHQFVKDYGSFHMTFNTDDGTDLIDYLFTLF